MCNYSAMKPGIRIFITVLVIGGLTSGCRTYGGYNSESATYEQMQQAHRVFEEELNRARADLAKLQAAAGEQPDLSRTATRYAKVVEGHEVVLAEHADLIAGLSADSDYRDLKRAFGGIVAQQRTIRIQYEGVLNNAFASQDTTSIAERPYALIPPYYERIRQDERALTVNELLAGARSGRTSSPGLMSPSEMPASSEADSVGAASEAHPDSVAGSAESEAGGH